MALGICFVGGHVNSSNFLLQFVGLKFPVTTEPHYSPNLLIKRQVLDLPVVLFEDHKGRGDFINIVTPLVRYKVSCRIISEHPSCVGASFRTIKLQASIHSPILGVRNAGPGDDHIGEESVHDDHDGSRSSGAVETLARLDEVAV
jgi:hypothetical protein